MGLDLYVGLPSGAWKLGVFAIVMIIALMLVNSLAPRFLRGLLGAGVLLGGIYLFAVWLSL